MSRPLVLILIACLVASIGVVGCKSKRDRIKVQDDQPDQWVWVAELYSEDADQAFDWNSSLAGVVRVEIKADNFAGLVRVRVVDGNGDQVFDEEVGAAGASFRDSYFTMPATPGNWTIFIKLEDVTGDLRVLIDQNA